MYSPPRYEVENGLMCSEVKFVVGETLITFRVMF